MKEVTVRCFGNTSGFIGVLITPEKAEGVFFECNNMSGTLQPQMSEG